MPKKKLETILYMGVQNTSEFYDRNDCDNKIFREASRWRRKKKKLFADIVQDGVHFPAIVQKTDSQL